MVENWKAFIDQAYGRGRLENGTNLFPVFRAAATERAIAKVQVALGYDFPHTFKALMKQSNGIGELYGFEKKKSRPMPLIFPIREIETLNRDFRKLSNKLEFDFNQIILFGQPGVDGIYFGFKAGAKSDRAMQWDPGERQIQQIASE